MHDNDPWLSLDACGRLRRLSERLEDLDMTDKIQVLHRQSCGGCADIHLGKMKDSPRYFAIKKPRFAGTDDMLNFTKVRSTCIILIQMKLNFHQKVVREMRIWSELFHENILLLRGFIREEGTNCPSFITDWMENGSLRLFLSKVNVDEHKMVRH